MTDKNKFLQVSGTIRSFRRAEPLKTAVGAICVDDRWIRVALDALPHAHLTTKTQRHVQRTDTANTDDVCTLLQNCVGKPVTIGLRRGYDGDLLVLWLVSDTAQLASASRSELLSDAYKRLTRWAPWFLLSLAIAVLSCYYMMSSFSLVILFVFDAIALLFCSFNCAASLLEIYSAHFDSALRQSWKALENILSSRKPPDRDVTRWPAQFPPANIPDKFPDLQRDDGAEPALRRICGPIAKIKVDDVNAGGAIYMPASSGAMYAGNNRIHYQRFQFDINNESCVLFVSRDQGGNTVFLAQGDRVAAIIADVESASAAGPKLALALHNLEDGRTYICHRIMFPQAKAIRRPFIGTCRMAIVTPRYFKYVRRMLLWLWLLTLVIAESIAVSVGRPDGQLSWQFLAFMAVMATLPLITIWAGFAVPLYRWRLGPPSSRQRLAQRVYALLGMASAFHLPKNVREV